MPRKSKRPCSHPGCPNLTDSKYCEEHKSHQQKAEVTTASGEKLVRLTSVSIRCVYGVWLTDGM